MYCTTNPQKESMTPPIGWSRDWSTLGRAYSMKNPAISTTDLAILSEDEFDISEKGFYTHDVLLTTGSTLKIEFKKIIIKEMK